MFASLHALSLFLLQEAEVGWDPVHLWQQMGTPAKLVVVLLFVMSAYSIGVMIDRALAYSAAKKQSRQFAPLVAGASKYKPVIDFSLTLDGLRIIYQRNQSGSRHR